MPYALCDGRLPRPRLTEKVKISRTSPILQKCDYWAIFDPIFHTLHYYINNLSCPDPILKIPTQVNQAVRRKRR